PEYVKDQPRPDRSLVIAAQATALQWTFDPNFGFGSQPGPVLDYVRGVLIFNFVLDDPKKAEPKPE
ncbi:MAG: hypothetical protein LC114_05095, partial [Bryobacterales bacterium]|nr:hypothetical protein [Bryobacterales bacterium]